MHIKKTSTNRPCWMLALLLGLGGCGSQPDTIQTSGPTAAAPVPVPDAPDPVSTPTPEPTPPAPPSMPANHPPTVALKGGGSCHPSFEYEAHVTPCTVMFEAEASDPDGDALSYEWSGCASGSGARAECVVSAPGEFPARVRVSDVHGASSGARGVAQGTNEAPKARIGYAPASLAPGQEGEFLGWIEDEDVFCGRQWCREARVSGACVGKPSLECTCLAGLELHARAGASPGTCHIEVELVDPWGRVGVTRFDVPVR